MISGYMIRKYNVPFKIIEWTKSFFNSDNYSDHVELSKHVKVNSIELIITDENMKILNEQREFALRLGERYMDHPDFTGYVKGKLVHNGDTVKIKLRQKGLLIDHFDDPLKCSYKIKIRGRNTFLGMKKFAIQHPKTRNYVNEWLLHKMFQKEGLISLRYNFVNVTINGRNSGIYAMEENMHKNLIENNNLKEGPIFRFDIASGTGPMFYHDLRPYCRGRLNSDSSMLAQYKNAEQQITDFRNGSRKTSDIFDVNKMAKFMAIIDLTGHHHASHPHNLKFYLNPVTGLIEPVGYDNCAFVPLEEQGLIGSYKNVIATPLNRGEITFKNDPLSEMLFNDPIFFEAYIQHLRTISNVEWLETFFNDIDSNLQNQLSIIWKSYPEYNFDKKNVLFHNQEFIRKSLSEYTHPTIRNNTIFKDSTASYLEVWSNNPLPIIIDKVTVNDTNYQLNKHLLESYLPLTNVCYKKLYINRSISDSAIIELKYHYLGVDEIEQVSYHCFSEPKLDYVNYSLPIVNHSTKLTDFISSKNDTIIEFKGKNHEIANNIIIPKGYIIKIYPGAKLNFTNFAKIISHSPMVSIGTESDSINFQSKDGTGEGIFILNAVTESKFEYCNFHNLSNLNYESWKLSGAVNIYKADIEFNKCTFSNNLKGDDMLNIMNSSFSLSECHFKNIISDAFDGDFVNGSIDKCSFNNIGNDAMDFSGSNIKINSCEITNTQDKGVSAGEKSIITAEKTSILNSSIALTAKDQSSIKGSNITIDNTDISVCAFQKKSQFGPSFIQLSSSSLGKAEIDYLIEHGSTLILNNNEITEKREKVLDLLYGNVYGKKTVK